MTSRPGSLSQHVTARADQDACRWPVEATRRQRDCDGRGPPSRRPAGARPAGARRSRSIAAREGRAFGRARGAWSRASSGDDEGAGRLCFSGLLTDDAITRCVHIVIHQSGAIHQVNIYIKMLMYSARIHHIHQHEHGNTAVILYIRILMYIYIKYTSVYIKLMYHHPSERRRLKKAPQAIFFY